jgi:hypothetical protein
MSDSAENERVAAQGRAGKRLAENGGNVPAEPARLIQ